MSTLLKMKVARCVNALWITGADVSVAITRSGSQVESNSGTTDATGYLELSFTDLQDKDQARITVKPSGENADADHTLAWSWNDSRQACSWEIVNDSGTCLDSWYDEPGQIVRLSYS